MTILETSTIDPLAECFAAEERRFLDPAYLKREDIPPQGTWPLDVPRWDGYTSLEGRTILLWSEQGHGDTIQYIRYAPMLAQRGATVHVGCHPKLARLFSTAPGIAKIYARPDELAGAGLSPKAGLLPKATYDLHAPILSLPYLFGTTLETIPAVVPYLRPPAELVPLQEHGFKIGLVWAGNPNHRNDAQRSMHLVGMLPLLTIDAEWYSLQVGQAASQIKALGLSTVLHDLAPRLNDFHDTASVISQLDLVITVDTAVAHLAGALGKPVWILLPFDADWRWLQGQDSPWYPTARLFRQPWPGNWGAVIQDVTTALACLRRAATRTADNIGTPRGSIAAL